MPRSKRLEIEMDHPSDKLYDVDIEPRHIKGEPEISHRVFTQLIGTHTFVKTHLPKSRVKDLVRRAGFGYRTWEIKKIRRVPLGGLMRSDTVCVTPRKK